MKESSRNSKIILILGPTASGKTKEAIRLAKEQNGEVISVDSRQVYKRLNIGTEKITLEEMDGVPHHLIDIREPNEPYSASDFVQDADALIAKLHTENKTPILAGGSHFYIDAFLYGLPNIPPNEKLRAELASKTNEELLKEISRKSAETAERLDPANRRRLIRALEILESSDQIPTRTLRKFPYHIEWILLEPSVEEHRARIDARLSETLANGLIEETKAIREKVGNERLNELGLEYRIVGEYLRGERTEESLFPTLSSKLWQYARRQRAWLRKLKTEYDAASFKL